MTNIVKLNELSLSIYIYNYTQYNNEQIRMLKVRRKNIENIIIYCSYSLHFLNFIKQKKIIIIIISQIYKYYLIAHFILTYYYV